MAANTRSRKSASPSPSRVNASARSKPKPCASCATPRVRGNSAPSSKARRATTYKQAKFKTRNASPSEAFSLSEICPLQASTAGHRAACAACSEMAASLEGRKNAMMRPGAEALRLHGLSEGDPESVEIPNHELTHAIEGIVNVFDDLDLVLQALIKLVYAVRRDVEVDFATGLVARFPARVEHDFAVSEGQLRPVHFPILYFLSKEFEPHRRVPIRGRANIRNMNHWNDCLRHGSLARVRRRPDTRRG